MSLESEINEFTKSYYDELPLFEIREPKVIHFTKIGTHLFTEPEISIIDLPLIQRLRYILQLGPAYNVYPTARHSRFEHTLGVSIRILQMWEALEKNGSLNLLSQMKRKKIIQNLRIASLLHDIGHGPFSHVSEVVLNDFTSIENATIKEAAKPHEVIGYYIIKSDIMGNYLDRLNNFYHISINQDEIANYLIKKTKQDETQYIADLLNGEIDADKLDYIYRDSYFSGVELSFQIDRLLYALIIDKVPGTTKKKLMLSERGILPFEQLLFSKIVLYSSIYHHQKIRAIDNMIIAILRRLIECEIPVNGKEIESPVDFLRLDDSDILNLKTTDEKINELCSSLKKRRTFKRSLVISYKTIDIEKDEFIQNKMFDFLQYAEYPREIRRLNKILAERIGKGCTEYDVAIDLPIPPTLPAATQRIIKDGNKYLPMADIFPHKDWLDAYISNKWFGYVFATEKFREDAKKEGKELIEERFKIKLTSEAENLAKLS